MKLLAGASDLRSPEGAGAPGGRGQGEGGTGGSKGHHAAGGVTRERVEYVTESEREEDELTQTRHNLAALRPTAYTDSRWLLNLTCTPPSTPHP